MAIGRISGSVLKSNLTRNGTDLAFETNLLYLDVTNSRVGIGTSEPTTALQVNGTITATALAVTGSTATINSKEIMVGKSEGTNFTNSLLVGHTTTGTLNDAQDNTGVGIGALDTITSADSVTAIGKDAAQAVTSGGYSTVVGAGAYFTNSTGTNNTAIGRFSLRQSSGSNNVALGKDSGESLSSGSQNIIIGSNTGDQYPTTGSGNVLIGNNIDADASDSARTLKIAGYDGTTTTTWIKGTSAGAITFNSAYTFPTADGSAGQFLTTNGSGALSFATVSTNSISQANSNVTVTDSGTGAVTIAADGNTIITMNATTALDVSAVTNAIRLPNGTTDQRPTGALGMVRYNSSTDNIEGYTTTGGWAKLGATTSTAENTDDTSTGEKTAISTSAVVVDQFATGSFDSAWYLAVTRDEINNELSTAKYSVVHNNSSAFVSTSHLTRSHTATDFISTDADVNSGNVRLKATGTSVVNSVSYYRIAVGDNTTAGTTGSVTNIINADLDSASEVLDTWAKGDYRGAKYYISVNSSAKTELANIEALVVHDGTTAYITTYGDVFTGNNSLINLTAAVDGSNVKLSATGNEPNLRVTLQRIVLADDEAGSTGDNVNVVGATTVGSGATALDTFSTQVYTGAFYVVTGYNSTEGASSIAEVMVVAGDSAYVSTGPSVSTKGTDQLTFTASLSGTTTTLSAASTSGGSTTVNAYRVHMLRGAGGAATSDTVLVSTTQTISGAKTFSNSVVMMTNLPTSDPNNAGQLWNSSGTLKISAG